MLASLTAICEAEPQRQMMGECDESAVGKQLPEFMYGLIEEDQGNGFHSVEVPLSEGLPRAPPGRRHDLGNVTRSSQGPSWTSAALSTSTSLRSCCVTTRNISGSCAISRETLRKSR